jgi:hypothetical protein
MRESEYSLPSIQKSRQEGDRKQARRKRYSLHRNKPEEIVGASNHQEKESREEEGV